MRVIHKYQLNVGSNVLDIAGGNFNPLCLQIQHDRITLWAEVDTSLPRSNKGVGVFGTGWEIPNHGRYIGTVQYSDGTVWHAYW